MHLQKCMHSYIPNCQMCVRKHYKYTYIIVQHADTQKAHAYISKSICIEIHTYLYTFLKSAPRNAYMLWSTSPTTSTECGCSVCMVNN